MKYIIKNCPNILLQKAVYPVCALTWEITDSSEIFDKYSRCQDCTDYLIKQVVELCKDVNCDALISTSINNKTRKNRCGTIDSMPLCCEVMAKKDILNLLEIEEINE